MSAEIHNVHIRGSVEESGLLYVDDSYPWGLRLVVEGTELSAVGDDLFASLVSLRLSLEADDRLICVAGARSDVFPSGMSRQSSGGRLAYKLTPGRKPSRDDLVDIFEPAPCDTVVRVAEQQKSVRRIHDSN